MPLKSNRTPKKEHRKKDIKKEHRKEEHRNFPNEKRFILKFEVLKHHFNPVKIAPTFEKIFKRL